jgi:signal transduction histidine kinase
VHISEYESGDARIWEADIYPIPGGGENLTFVLIMAIEVTTAVRERRRAELEREEQAALLRATAARMASLERVKSDFLNLASHELRGPLAVLRGYLAMLSDGSLGELPPQTRNILPILNAKAGQMAMLITQLLEAARLEDSRLQLKLEPVDLARLVTHAANTMGALVGPKHSIIRDIPSAEVLVVADPVRVETIIVNLLDNALKYSPEGGEVVVALGEVDGTARLAVHDRGMGIAGEDLPRLFTRFGRLVTADNSHIPGTGLGLYLSRELARMHGGDISVTSVLGEGSEFVLTLPKEGPQAESGNLAVAQGESGSGG